MIKFFTKIFSTLGLLMASSAAFAQQTFPISDNDQSKKIFLDSMFGPLVGGGASEFSGVIGVFNSAMLILAGILVLYTLIAGTLSTAHEGEMLGRKWSSVYIPIRTSVGAAMIFPLGQGFCAIQYIVMWIAMQGIGFADVLVKTFVDQTFAPNQFNPPSNYGARREALEKWLIAASCEKAMGTFRKVVQGSSASVIHNSPVLPVMIGKADDINSVKYTYVGGLCGTYMITNAGNPTFGMDDSFASMDMEQFYDALYAVNISQTEAAKAKIEVLAQKIADSDDENEALTTEVAGTLDSIATNWEKAVRDKALEVFREQAKSENGTKFREQVVSDGWLTFGGWYMEIARVQDAISKAMSTVPSVTGNAYERTLEKEESGFWANVFSTAVFDDDSKAAVKRAKAMSSYTFKSGGSENSLTDYAESSGISSYIIKWFITPDYKHMTDSNQDFSQNPVIMIQNLGRNMVGWGTAAYVAAMVVILAVDREVLGNSTAKLSVLAPMITALAGIIMVTGAFLSVYPPMLPYVLWMGAVLGWVIFLVEAIIAAPLWIVAQIAPDGDGVVGRGGQGYMLVLSLFLKPGLMVLGFVAAVIVMKPMGYLINSTFIGAFMSGASPSWYGVVTAIMGCILYATTMISVINRVFALIHTIPDKILRWMGSGGDNDLSGAAQGFEGNITNKMIGAGAFARTLGDSGMSSARELRSMRQHDAQLERSQKDSAHNANLQNLGNHKNEIGSANEEANDALRDMQNADVSDKADAGFKADQEKLQSAVDKADVHSFKAAQAQAQTAISNAEKKGPQATPQELNEAQQAQDFLNDSGSVDSNNPEAVRNYMSSSAGKYSNNSWGQTMVRANASRDQITRKAESLEELRNDKKNPPPPPPPNDDDDGDEE